jgi:intraflagellar transport protein 46
VLSGTTRSGMADSDEFEYGDDEFYAGGGGAGEGDGTKVIQNQPHDEEFDLSEDGSGMSDAGHGQQEQAAAAAAETHEFASGAEFTSGAGGIQGDSPSDFGASPTKGQGIFDDDGFGSQEGGANGGEQDGGGGRSGVDPGGMSDASPPAPSDFDASAFADLDVTDDVKEILQYIGRYKPTVIDLDTHVKPFVPDYIPAVGDIDGFLKVPRPDGQPDYLGLKVLDEPAAKQSNTTVLNLQLRASSKSAVAAPTPVDSIANAARHPAKIREWVANIEKIHKNQSPAAETVAYRRPMPDIEALMQEWPPAVEHALRQARLPDASIDLDLTTFAKVVCNIMDIPVHGNVVESLHVLFTLYGEFKSNPHFAARMRDGY